VLTATTNLLAVAGVFGIGLIIGLVVLMTAEEALTAVAKTAARDISGSFWVGLLWQLLAVPLLVGLGVRELSVDTPSIPSVKASVRLFSVPECQALAKEVLALSSTQAVIQHLEKFHSNA
jgi:phosphocarrier protein FPr/phosphocarrier protein